jgi:exonuclease SbcC
LSPEARAELDERFNEAQQQLKLQQAQLKQLEQQHTWLKDLRQLQDAQHAATEQLHSAQQQWEGLADERLKLTRLEHLAPQRHQFARKTELDALLTPLAAQIAAHTRQQHELTERQTVLEHHLTATQTALSEAQQRQSESAPRLRQAFEEQSTLARLAKEAALSADAKHTAEQACLQGQSAIQSLLEKQTQVAERLQRIATELERSSHLASLGDAWNAYRDRLQQLMLIGNRLNKGQAELATLELNATRSAEAFASKAAT